MKAFRDRPIRQKLTLVIIVTGSAALLLAGAAIISFELLTYRPMALRELTTLADIVGANSAAAIVFKDAASAEETLGSLRARPDVIAARLYAADGSVFARYGRSPGGPELLPDTPPPGAHVFERDQLIVHRPVVHNNKKVGTIALQLDLVEQRERLRRIAGVVAVLLVASPLVGLVVAAALHRLITGPILGLAGIAQLVTTKKDYSARMTGRSGDEVGQLIDSFNEMLDQIQSRDAELQRAHNELEERVQVRTVELALAEAKYRTLVEQLPAITYVAEFGEAGRWTYVSPQIQLLLGFAPQEWMDDPDLWFRQLHPDDRAHVLVAEARCRETGTPLRCDYRMLARDGRVVWFSDEATVVRSAEGQALFLQGILLDITERHRAEEALHQSEERFRHLFEGSPDPIFVEDLQGNVRDANPAAARLHGVDREALVGKNVVDLVPPELKDHVIRGRAGMVNGEAGHIESLSLGAGGRIIPVEIRTSSIDYLGQPAILLHVRDITERKQAEQELKNTAAALERSNKELEVFAYVASHDLQEPLRAIAGCVQILQQRYKGKIDERADELIKHVVDGATRMQALINDLLHYSRVDTRGKPFVPTHCEEVITDALSNLEVAIQENAAKVTHDRLPEVTADPTQLTQLLQNLIGNAIKYHGERAPAVHVGVQRLDGEWQFSVRDNGIGIEPEYFERIFGIFQRLHTRQEYAGTGIGLAVCKKIVERHGGRIWLESAPGQGTTFLFTLPDQKEARA